ncbi:MAG TPA: DUF305 domain-containing protein [bacterium]|nr:DUF305 domain-containing protein [bacterium]
MRIALVIGWVLTAVSLTSAAAPSTGTADPTVARLSSLNGDAFDVAFMQALIPVDDEAIEMAMTATLYADHGELLRWNQVAVERGNEHVRKMLTWLQQAGAGPAERRAGVTTVSVKKLRSLRGAALERAYLPLMAAQLDKTVALTRLAAERARRPELREFAKDAVRVESQDSAMLRGWIKQWY